VDRSQNWFQRFGSLPFTLNACDHPGGYRKRPFLKGQIVDIKPEIPVSKADSAFNPAPASNIDRPKAAVPTECRGPLPDRIIDVPKPFAIRSSIGQPVDAHYSQVVLLPWNSDLCVTEIDQDRIRKKIVPFYRIQMPKLIVKVNKDLSFGGDRVKMICF
jgi:hypothetical protein